ncbi:MAG: hypothetical protein HY698_11315 [Deltaproteobacteria bacterium]|nr:hypothetical protein [Deltaproteobacteria bacterium]
MVDRAHVRRLAAEWKASVMHTTDVRDEEEPTLELLTYQLWDGEIEVDALGPVAERSVDLGDGLTARMVALCCGHVVEYRLGNSSLSEVVAAVGRDPAVAPAVDFPITESRAARTFEVSGFRIRSAARVVDLTLGRTRWMSSMAADPSMRGRILAVSSSSGPGDLRLVMVAPSGEARVTAARAFRREGKVLITETQVSKC